MTITAERTWLDGALVATRDAVLPLMAHASQRGSLVFDVGSFYVTARGPALFRVRDHVARFHRSASIVGLELAFDEDALVQAALSVVRDNDRAGCEQGLIRWSAFYAAREPDLIPLDAATHVAVAMQRLTETPSHAPIAVAVFDDARRASPHALPPETKAAGAYLGPMIAKRRAKAMGCDEVVLLDEEGNIAEAPTANAFAVIDGTLWTPPLGRILPGITRRSTLAVATEEGIPIREASLSREAFAAADEAFLTATSLPLSPIARVNKDALKSAPGPITRRIHDRLMAARMGTDPRHPEWLTFT